MKILVLGSAGQIGKPLTAYLRRLKHDVVEFDNYINPETDLRTPNILSLYDIDFVFFLAYDVGGAKYLKAYQSSYDFISNNIKIMCNTFEALKSYGTPFIFTSSQMAGMDSEYGLLKQIGEKYTNTLNGKIVRLWNVYGSENNSIKSHVITDFINMAKRDYIKMRTTGEELRQFLYVDDCVECLTALMNCPGESYDVSSFEWTSIKEVADLIASIFNCPVYPGSTKDDVQREEIKEPKKDILQYWQPKTSLIQGVNKLI